MSLTAALTRALTRAVCPGTRAGFSTSRTASRAASPVVKPKDGVRQVAEMTPEQIEELSVFQAAGGLTTAAFGGIVVFVIGAGATLGVAAGISQVLGHTMNSKPPEPPPPPTRDELKAKLAEWRKQPRGAQRNDATRAIKTQLREMRKAEGSWW